ncbi:alkaline ceramidase [Cyclobacterium jeungdonense]|uniref:Alkaline ceramidase n=1 Tax=Cyclobacterium jeungdonense TaxID=708087 RepID=A0ABT8C753_9BACT|nr:alkaline ceramidase [Cyclobacterium jeungdonense]MDN3687897.1 alkaline ceramidase [Cyclobacterium jeungdonense]
MPPLRFSITAIVKFLLYLVGFFLLLFLATITTVDWTHYKKKGYYKETLATLDSLPVLGSDQGFLLGGWAKANMTPPAPVPLVAYRPRGNYEFVQDSSFVKALILGNPDFKVAFLNYELLIIHPKLAETLRKEIDEGDFPIDHVYFTATHTHSGMGGTIPGPVGSLALGGWNKDLVDLISASTLKALQEALVQMDTVQLDYSKSNAENFVTNRLVATDPVDPFIRQLIISNQAGASASLITFSAHATCLSSRFMGLSGDYPFYFSEKLEEQHDLVLFAAGAVGSHRPHIQGNDVESVKNYAAKLDSIIDHNPDKTIELNENGIFAAKLPLQLREPHFRISNHWRIRPWLFDWAIGDYPAHFDLIKIGNTLFISSSGEVSGVFYEAWEKQAAGLGMNLIITTFNGGYIGYITPDKYYQEDYYEVRDMNFYGPYNGAYFKEVIGELIDLGAGL